MNSESQKELPFGYIRKTNWRGKTIIVPHPAFKKFTKAAFKDYASNKKNLKEIAKEIPALKEKLAAPSRWRRFLSLGRG